jgi:hypothetical protein
VRFAPWQTLNRERRFPTKSSRRHEGRKSIKSFKEESWLQLSSAKLLEKLALAAD